MFGDAALVAWDRDVPAHVVTSSWHITQWFSPMWAMSNVDDWRQDGLGVVIFNGPRGIRCVLHSTEDEIGVAWFVDAPSISTTTAGTGRSP